MKPIQICCLALFVLIAKCSVAQSPSAKGAATSPKLEIRGLKTVPAGNYLITLEQNGAVKRVNLRVDGNKGKVVNSNDPQFKGVAVSFQPFEGDGRFVARMAVGDGFFTQLWIFRADGVAAVRESPDRGEIQSAVPVSGESIELPPVKG